MPRLIWTPPALGDIRRLHRFLMSDNPDAARCAVAAIRSGAKVLADQPHIGRRVEAMASEFREWLIAFGNSGYVVLYRYDGRTVLILAVRHQREAGY